MTFSRLLKVILHPIRTGFFNLKIRYKLALSYFLITIIPIAAIGFISYSRTLSYVKSQNVIIISGIQQQFNTNLTSKLNSYVNISQSIYLNRSIQKYLFSNYSTRYLEFRFITDFLSPLLTAMLQSVNAGVHLDLVHFNDQLGSDVFNNFIHKTAESPAYPYLDSSILPGRATFNIYNARKIADADWFRYIENNVKDYTWLQVSDDEKNNNITLAKPLYNFLYTTQKPVGYIFITVKLQDLVENSAAQVGDGGVFHLVFDEKGKLLSPDEKKISFYTAHQNELSACLLSEDSSESLFLKDYVVLRGVNELNGWNILTVSPIKSMNDSIIKIRNSTVLYTFLALLVLFTVTNLLAASFSNRIISITHKMQKLHSKNLDHKVTELYDDEIGYLARTFNDMTTRMDNLIRENYQANIDMKEAQLKALQAQINPHFLYNSLSCISRLGDIGDSGNINRMVRALTTFYRMTLNKGRDMIKISDELEQVKAYIEIYTIRKGDAINVVYRLDEAIMDYYTVKVILQPFAENVLEHALYDRETPINLIIEAGMEADIIYFHIIDDGIGIPADILKGIFAGPGEIPGGGYGIKNVDDRIKLQFGNQYGVSIFSLPGAGTKVTVSIPKYKRL